MNLSIKKISISAVLLGVLVFTLYFFASWKISHLKNLEQFTQWLNDKDNECLMERNIAGVKVNVKYYPPLYSALNDMNIQYSNQDKKHEIDSVLNVRNNIMTFLFSIGPDKNIPSERQVSSIMSEGVSGYSSFVERVMSTNFMMDQNISLYVDGVKYSPLLCVVENVYELSDTRNFVVIFGSEGKNINEGKEYIFEYNDLYFGMGKVQFVFSNKALDAARKIKVINS